MFKTTTFALASLTIAMSGSATDASVIYHHDFTGGSNVEMTTADTTTAPQVNNSGNAVVWDTHANTKQNGATAANTSNWLPYTFGKAIYELEAEFEMAYVEGGQNWFAVGFSANHAGTTFANGSFSTGSTNAYYWMLQRQNGDWSAYNGAATGGNFNTGTGTPPSTTIPTIMKFVFDNRDEDARTIAMYLNGVQLDLDPNSPALTRTVTLVPVGVGWGKSNPGSSALINTFTLSVVPEPSAVLLLGLGSLGMLARRRRDRA